MSGMTNQQIRPSTVRLWYRIHKWTSLTCTAFLLITCLTGLPLIFADEIEAALSHTPERAPLAPGAPTANLDSIVQQATDRFPGMHPLSLVWDDDEPVLTVYMSPTLRPKPGQVRSLTFDQESGTVLTSNQPNKKLTVALLRLHSQLFMDLPGELLLGVMALLFLCSLVSGTLVYGPFMRRLNFGTYRRNASPRVRWFDLHNLLGIVTLSWALVVGATGLMNTLTRPLFDTWRANVLPPLLAPYRGKPMPSHLGSLDAAVARASSALPKTKLSSVIFPNPTLASPRHYVIWTKGNTPITARVRTPVLVDIETERVIVANNLPWYLRVLEVSRPLHFGDYGGLPLKIIWALFDIALIVVLTSGLYLWLSRRKRSVEEELNRLVKLEELPVEPPSGGVLTR